MPTAYPTTAKFRRLAVSRDLLAHEPANARERLCAAFIRRRLHPRRRAYACGRTRCDVAALDEGTNYEMASRNCISTNFAPLLRSRQHSARRYGWNAARVWCTDVWRTRVWWTRVIRLSWLRRTHVRWTCVTGLTRLSWLWRTRVWWTRVWRTRVTRFTRLSWLWWTRVRWTHASVSVRPGKVELRAFGAGDP